VTPIDGENLRKIVSSEVSRCRDFIFPSQEICLGKT